VSQPIAFIAAILLDRWTVWATSGSVLIRPAIVLSVAAIVIGVVLWKASGSLPLSLLVTDVLVLFTLRELFLALVFGAVIAAWALLQAARRAMGARPFPAEVPWAMARSAGIFAIGFLVVGALGAARSASAAGPIMDLPSYQLRPTSEPNIYLVLLDGYPRADTLRDTFGIDNAPFLSALEDRGFDVSPDARTNYNKTWLTFASMLNGAYIDDMLGDQATPNHPTAELRWLQVLNSQARIPAALRDAGYAIRTVASQYTSTTLQSADTIVTPSQLNEFEIHLAASSPWTAFFRDQVADALAAGQAERVAETIDVTVELARTGSEPQFVFSHVHSPHTPFVLTDDGSKPAAPACFPYGCSFWEPRLVRLEIDLDEYGRQLARQINRLNELVLDGMDRLLAADPDAIVILMSDHGLRFATDDTDEHYRSFFAARTPGHPDLFPPDIAPVNVLRTLVSAYFEADAEPLAYRSWSLDWAYNLRLEARE